MVERMIAFMEQECFEKVQEIWNKSEEEYHMVYGQVLHEGRAKIKKVYDYKEQQFNKNKLVQRGVMAHRGNMEVLEAKQAAIEFVLQKVNLGVRDNIRSDVQFYRRIMHELILQAAVQLLEPVIGLRAMACDREMLDEELLEGVTREYESIVGVPPQVVATRSSDSWRLTRRSIQPPARPKTLQFEIDERLFLDDSSIGGVVVWARQGRICLDNTLKTRIDRIVASTLQFLKIILFE